MIRKSIRARLAIVFSLCLSVLMMTAVAGIIWYTKRSTERNADGILTAAAHRAVIESKEPYSPAELITEEREDLVGSDLVMKIVDANGNMLAQTQNSLRGLSTKCTEDWRVATRRLGSGDTVIVGMPWEKANEAQADHATMLISLGAFVVVIASTGAWFLVGRALRPIPLLARQANASSADVLAIALEPPSQDHEMVELVDTLNGLLRRVTETTAAKGRFYSAASHELRTPLQALSGHLELALTRDRSNEEYKAAVEEAYAQANRLVSLVRSLLLLYQLDVSTTLPAKEPVDLVEVCQRSLSHADEIVKERGLEVDMCAPAEAEILAPPNHMEILVRNLIENAAKYASECGHVNAVIAANGQTTRLEIVNDSVTPPQWKFNELFEPFSRPDASRNIRTGGTGLGLAICKSIAEANGWMLDLLSEPKSVRAVLVIPHERNTSAV